MENTNHILHSTVIHVFTLGWDSIYCRKWPTAGMDDQALEGISRVTNIGLPAVTVFIHILGVEDTSPKSLQLGGLC